MRLAHRRLGVVIVAVCAVGAGLGVTPGASAAPTAPPASASAHLSIPDGGGTMHAGSVSTGIPSPTGRASATATPAGYTVTGIDVASYQANVNWSVVAANGRHFAYVKASEGTTYQNPYFDQQYGGARPARSLHRCVCVRPTRRRRPRPAGAVLPASALRPRRQDPAVDAGPRSALCAHERGTQCWNLSPAQMVAWIRAFVATVQAATAQPMLIYTNPNWWNPCTGNATAFSGQLLNIRPGIPPLRPCSRPAGRSGRSGSTPTRVASPATRDIFAGNLNQLSLLARPGLAPGTSPSITAVKGGGYEIAYQAVTGELVTIGTAGYRVWGARSGGGHQSEHRRLAERWLRGGVPGEFRPPVDRRFRR